MISYNSSTVIIGRLIFILSDNGTRKMDKLTIEDRGALVEALTIDVAVGATTASLPSVTEKAAAKQ